MTADLTKAIANSFGELNHKPHRTRKKLIQRRFEMALDVMRLLVDRIHRMNSILEKTKR